MLNTAADYEGNIAMCDPHFTDYISDFNEWQGPYAHVRRCLYKKDTFEYNFEHARALWKAYPNERKAMFLSFMDMHEGTYTVVKHLDKPLAAFLREMEAQNTTVILFSDHGPHLSGIKAAIGYEQRSIEILNPMLYAANVKGISSAQR